MAFRVLPNGVTRLTGQGSTTSGGLGGLPADPYDLWRQAYRPRNPASVLETSGATGNPAGPSAYLMKSPPKQMPDDEAHAAVERFIKQYGSGIV